ncbi:hypothetical protein GCM10010349_19930 [Streptomyces flavofungini]|nr:hypothetical protein GCM10010349_19930 [Streptomyces flavofungini]
MDARQLASALQQAGVADGYYWIEGVHEPTPTPPDFAYLRRERAGKPEEEGAWEVGVHERGQVPPGGPGPCRGGGVRAAAEPADVSGADRGWAGPAVVGRCGAVSARG